MAGYIEQRGNSFRLVYMKDKKKHCKTVKVAKPKDAEKELAKFIAEIEGNNFIEPSKVTFENFIKRWLTEYAERDLAPKTVHRYKQILNTRVIPAMGHLKVEQIKPVHLIEFYNNLMEDGIREDKDKDGNKKKGGLSGKTILQHHRIISSILNDAVQWQVIGSNPASRVKPPKVERKEAKFYDEEQAAALLEALKGEKLKHKALVHIAVLTGLRRGEIMGLDWTDIDFEKGTLEVKRAGQYIPGQGTFTKTPKNETSKRIISLPASLITLLKQYKASQNAKRLKLGTKWQQREKIKLGEQWQETDRVFTTWDGSPGHPEWPSQWFSKFIVKKELPPLNFHGLRHTSITLLIGQGVSLVNASKRAGHSNVSTTGNIYAHALKSADRDAADKLENLFNGKSVKQA